LFSDIVMQDDNPDISWKLKPNVQAIYKAQPFSTNSLGLRNPEISIEKPAVTIRVAVLGRSITMGEGVADHEVFTQILQNRLNEWQPDSFEIINCAVSGYSVQQVLAFYETYVSVLNPDIIILSTSKKDLTRSKMKAIPSLSEVQPSITDLNYYLSYTYIYESCKFIIKKISAPFISTEWDEQLAGINVSEADTLTNDILLSSFFESRNREQIECYIFMPKRGEIESDDVIHGLRNWTEQHPGVTYLDINAYLQNRMPKKRHIYFGDTHPDPQVHALYGEALFEQFKSGSIRE